MFIIILMPAKKIKNNGIIAVSVIVLLLSIYYFFLGIKFQEKSKFPEIGEVSKKENSLRRKSEGSLSWTDIDQSSKIYPGDKIFTGSASAAQLNIFGIVEVGMTPTTLLKIERKADGGIVLQGGLGSFTAKVTGQSANAIIKLKDVTFELAGKGSEMLVDSTEEKTTVTAISGNVSVKKAEKGSNRQTTQALKTNEVLGMNKVGEATVVSVPAKLIAPAVSEVKVMMPKIPVHFKWETLMKDIPLSLELSKTPAFESVFLKKEIPVGTSEDDVLIDSPMRGVIYWRVTQKDKTEYFQSQQFEYQPLDPPTIYEPVFQENFPVANSAGLEFTWEKRFDLSYEGEIQQLDGGIGGAQKFTSDHPSFLAKGLTVGHYQIKIRGKRNNLLTDWTPWQPFSVGDIDRSDVELTSPGELAKATIQLPQKDVVLEWTGTGSQFQIQIATDENFKDIVNEAITDKKVYRWHINKEGKYFWHVDNRKKARAESTRSFFVVEPKIGLLTPTDKVEYLFHNEAFQNIKFSWVDASLSGQYVFEISNAANFKNILEHFELSKPEFELKLSKRDQVLYWRIKTNYQTSVPRMIKVRTIPELPVLTIADVQVKIQEDHTVIGGRSATNPSQQFGPDFVEVFLPQEERVASYHVEVLRDSIGKDIVIDKNLSSPIFRWNSPTPGEYFWRVFYRDSKGNISPKSSIARLVVEPKDVNAVKILPKLKPKPKPKPKPKTDSAMPY